MNVRELVKALQQLPDQDATVVIGEGTIPDLWLIVGGLVERRISIREDNPDSAGPGLDRGIEIV